MKKWNFYIHYFLPEMGQAFFLLFYDLKGYCRSFIQELLTKDFFFSPTY